VKKRLLILAAVLTFVVIVIAGAYGYRRFALHRELAALKAEGIAASTSGNHVHAVEALSKYLRRRADDPEALRYYAESRFANAQPNDLQADADVIAALQSLSQFGPLKPDEHRRLMQLYVLTRNDSGVCREADRLLSISSGDVEALAAKSMALMREHDWSAALLSARAWSQAAPLDLQAQTCNLSAMVESGTAPGDVVGHAAELRRAHPGDPRFELLESMALTQTGQAGEVAESMPKGVTPDPRSAVEWAKAAAARNQPDAVCAHLLVEQLDRLALFDESLALLRSRVLTAGDSYCRRALARRLCISQQWMDLEKLLEDNVKAEKPDPESLGLYAIAIMRLQRATEMEKIKTLLKNRPSEPLSNAWLLVVDNYAGRQGSTATQLVGSFEMALSLDPENPFFHYFIAEALLRIAEPDLAVEHLKLASARLATWEAPCTRLSEIYLSQGRSEAALTEASRAQFRESHAGNAHDLSLPLALGRAWLACLNAGRTSDRAGLEKFVDSIQRLMPGEEQTLAIRISLLIRGKDRDGATACLRKAINDPKPLSQGTLLTYASISRSAGLNLENECFDRCEREHGMTVDLAYGRATGLLINGQAAKGISFLDNARERAKAAGGIPDDLAWKVARARYLESAGDAGARAAWIAIANENPDNLSMQQTVLADRTVRSDRQFMDRLIERVHQLEGDGGLSWRIARARWILEDNGAAGVTRKDAENAARLLSAMLRTCPESIEAHLLMASCQHQLQNLDAAVEQYLAVRALLPDSADVSMRLVRILEERGDFAQAAQVLRPFTQGSLSEPTCLVAMGWLQERDGDLADAEQCYRRALSLSPDMTAAQNNLALILVKEGSDQNLQEALSLASRAVKANPAVAPLLDTLSSAQAKVHDYDGALHSIDQAITLDNSNLSFRVHQIELFVEAGRTDAARAAVGKLRPIVQNSAAQGAKDPDLKSRLQKMEDTLATAAGPDKQ
jgi:tetratricopeptide (TPR) repeat protein